MKLRISIRSTIYNADTEFTHCEQHISLYVMERPSFHATSGSSDPWEAVKPILEILYMSEKKKLKGVAFEMKTQHGFDRLYVAVSVGILQSEFLLTRDCSEHQYRYQFSKWKWSRKAGKDAMPHILKHVKHRAGAGKSSKVTLNGKVVETKKIRRALKDEKRAAIDSIVLKSFRNQNMIVEGPVLPFSNSL